MTYTWQATGKSTVVRSVSATTDTMSYAWSTAGTKTIRVLAENDGGGDTDIVTIDVVDPCPHPLTSVSVSGPTSGYTDTIYFFTAQV